jgi:hypothetical protein
MLGVVLLNVDGGPGSAPVVVRRCLLVWPEKGNDGIVVVSPRERGFTRNVLISDNRVESPLRGIWLAGKLSGVQVSGNIITGCTQAGIQIEDLAPESESVLLANNSAFHCASAFRIFSNRPATYAKGQVELAGNVFFDSEARDMVSLTASGRDVVPAHDDEMILQLWRFRCNRRDFSGSDSNIAMPRAPGDRKLEDDDLLGRDPHHPDQIRPANDSSLASQGAGKDDASLPTYIGALPPEGVEPWDWGRTWRARAPRPAPPDKDKPSP